MDPGEVRRRTAVHEAAHAVVAVLIGRPIRFVTIEPTVGTLGRTVFARSEMIIIKDHRQVEREIALHLAGFVSEIIHDPSTVPTGCADEVLYGFELAIELGHRPRGFERLVWRTTRMLIAVWPAVSVVARELERRRWLDGRVVKKLVRRELGVRQPER